jgi:single-strand DNA-binding protein
MQLITLLAYITSPPALMAPSGDKQLASFTVEITPYKQTDPPMPLQVTAWGERAPDVMANLTQDSWAIVAGRLRIEQRKPPEFQLEDFYRVAMPLDRPGVNSVALVGRAGKDPEVNYFEKGSMVAKFTLAVSRRSRDDEPDWFPLEIWGKQAQVAADYVRKGSLLGIIGSFKLDRWTDRSSGEERTKPVIRVDRLELLGSKRDAEGGAGAGGYSAPGYGGPASDEEVPF